MHVSGDRRGQLIGTGLAVLWLVTILLIDLLTHQAAFAPAILFAVSALIASAVLPPVPTSLFGVAAVGLTLSSNAWNHTWGTPQVWVRAADATLVSAAAVALSAVRVRREAQVARLVRIAEVAQKAMLPRLPAHIGPVAAGARYLSAAEDALVGGDLYDWFHSDRRICFVIGDVRGKGVGAVEQAARVIRAFRQSAAGGGDLATAASQMSAYLEPFLDDEEFVTASLVQIAGPDCMTLVSCGHPQPLLITRRGEARLVDLPAGLPLGLGSHYESVTVPWSPGDRLLLYTDGLSEARDARGEFLPVLPLAPLLRRADVDDALDGVLRQVREHVPGGRFTDDLAVLLLENADGQDGHAIDPRDTLVREAVQIPTLLDAVPETVPAGLADALPDGGSDSTTGTANGTPNSTTNGAAHEAVDRPEGALGG